MENTNEQGTAVVENVEQTGTKRGRKKTPQGMANIYLIVPAETLTALQGLCGGKSDAEKATEVAALVAGGMDWQKANRQVAEASKATNTPAGILQAFLATPNALKQIAKAQG